MQAPNLSPYFIDRASTLREDSDWNHTQLTGDARFIPIYQSSILCDATEPSKPCFLSPSQIDSPSTSTTFLGKIEGVAYFTLPIESEAIAQKLGQNHAACFQEYATRAPMLQSPYRDLLSLAHFTSYWHHRHQYCGACGSPTQIASAGHMRQCSTTTCQQQYFPSMDPAVIVLIEYGDRCLLGRQKNWREGMYSTLAGFVEPGETIEAAVLREVEEEAGIQVQEIRYHSSQAWLFPNSLMLGFTAKATTPKLQLDPNELDSADWFTREHIRSHPEMLPNQRSISYQLIQDWLRR